MSAIGRWRRVNPDRSLPTVDVEVGANLPADPESAIWLLPNTYPMVRIDSRHPRDLVSSDENTQATPNPSATSHAFGAAFVISTLIDRFSDIFAQILKPVRYVLMIVGPDDLAGISDKHISRSPLDGYDPVANPVLMFRQAGPVATEDWFEPFFQLFRENLESADPPLPLPSMLVTNIEAFGDTGAVGIYGNTSDGIPSGKGVLELAMADQSGELIAQGVTLESWLTARTLTQRGQTYDPFDPDSTPEPYDRDKNARWPGHAERVNIFIEAVLTNYAYGLDRGIYRPFRAAFGVDVPCAEWDLYCSSQDHQVPHRPLSRLHRIEANDESGLPIQRQCPANYNDPPNLAYNSPPPDPLHPGWETTWNWLQASQPAGFTPFATYPTTPPPGLNADTYLRMVLDVGCQVLDQCALAAPDKLLMPSVALGEANTQSDVDVLVPYMVRYMLHAVDRGAKEIWLFAPDWNTIPFQRARNHQLVKAFNGAAQGRVPMRNRMRRYI